MQCGRGTLPKGSEGGLGRRSRRTKGECHSPCMSERMPFGLVSAPTESPKSLFLTRVDKFDGILPQLMVLRCSKAWHPRGFDKSIPPLMSIPGCALLLLCFVCAYHSTSAAVLLTSFLPFLPKQCNCGRKNPTPGIGYKTPLVTMQPQRKTTMHFV